jgi:TonB family protein
MTRLFILLTLTLASAFAAETERFVQSLDAPKYPPLAYQARIQGTVKLSVVVNAEGQVETATVISGPLALQGGALKNVKSWRFAASTERKSSQLRVVYEYKVEGKEIPYTEPDKQHFHVNLELPARVEISAPPMTIDTFSSGSN